MAGACELFESGPDSRVAIAWTTPIAAGTGEWSGTPALVDGLGIAQIGGELQAFDVLDGALRWRSPLRQGVALNGGNVVASHGYAYIAGADSVYAVAVTDGRRLWAFAPPAQAALGEIAAGSDALYIGTRDHRVLALDLVTGAVRWQTDVGPLWTMFGVVTGLSTGDGMVYAGAIEFLNASGSTRRGHVFALDAATGELSWHHASQSDQTDVSSAPLVMGDRVFASDLHGGSVFALDRATGQLIWTKALGGLGPSHAPAFVEGSLVVGANDGFAYRLDPHTGDTEWRTDTGGSIAGFSTCGSTFIANNTRLHVLALSDGAELAVFFEGDQEDFLWSNIAVAGERGLVVGNRAVYGIRCD